MNNRQTRLGALLALAEADEEVPGMRAHLDGCPACYEDHQSLLALLAEEA